MQTPAEKKCPFLGNFALVIPPKIQGMKPEISVHPIECIKESCAFYDNGCEIKKFIKASVNGKA